MSELRIEEINGRQYEIHAIPNAGFEDEQRWAYYTFESINSWQATGRSGYVYMSAQEALDAGVQYLRTMAGKELEHGAR